MSKPRKRSQAHEDPFENDTADSTRGKKQAGAVPYLAGDGEEGSSPIARILRKYESELLARSGVTGVGIGQDEMGDDAIVVYVRDEVARRSIPSELDGVPVCIEITGDIDAY